MIDDDFISTSTFIFIMPSSQTVATDRNATLQTLIGEANAICDRPVVNLANCQLALQRAGIMLPAAAKRKDKDGDIFWGGCR